MFTWVVQKYYRYEDVLRESAICKSLWSQKSKSFY